MIVSIIIPVFNTKYEDLLKCLGDILNKGLILMIDKVVVQRMPDVFS